MKHRPPAAWPAPQASSLEAQMELVRQKQDMFRRQSEIADNLWRKIRSRAQTDAGLKDLLDKAEMYYRLLDQKNNSSDNEGTNGGG